MAAKKKVNKKKSDKKTHKNLKKSEKIVLKHNIEAILFAAGKSLELKFIAELCDTTEYQAKKQLQELEKDYKNHSVLMIVNQDTAWKMTVREQYLGVVRKIVADTELSKSVLETLSMIAYRNPALQSDIVKARGTVTYDHVAELVKLGFVVKERVGRSYVLKLSEKFFEYFEVDGKRIKEVFQPVKDRVDEQMLLGDLKVVDTNIDSSQKDIFKNKTQEERLGELEVFRLENQENAKKINDLKSSHKNFLDSIETEIDTFSKQTDEESKVFDEIKSSDVQNRINDIKTEDSDNEETNSSDDNEEEDSDENKEDSNNNSNTEETSDDDKEEDEDKVTSNDSDEDKEGSDNKEKDSDKLSSDELLSETDKAISELTKGN
jgi:segregation and condensation protein B